MNCAIHTDFFDDSCEACKQEYLDLKGIGQIPQNTGKKYKELTEERAKKLYEDLMLQYLKSGVSETEADRKAKAILRKQCAIRGITPWPWM
ncbi:MAG: hypothetical protein ACRD99_03335 [Nitrososphaera sp.]